MGMICVTDQITTHKSSIPFTCVQRWISSAIDFGAAILFIIINIALFIIDYNANRIFKTLLRFPQVKCCFFFLSFQHLLWSSFSHGSLSLSLCLSLCVCVVVVGFIVNFMNIWLLYVCCHWVIIIKQTELNVQLINRRWPCRPHTLARTPVPGVWYCHITETITIPFCNHSTADQFVHSIIAVIQFE